MARLSPKQAKAKLAELITKQKGKCYNLLHHEFSNPNCRKSIGIENAILEHKDNNASNNTPKNIRAFCHSCNTKKNPRGLSKRGIRQRDLLHRMYSLENKRMSEREIEEESENLPGSDNARPRSIEMKRNMECEPVFAEWLKNMMLEAQTMLVSDIVNGGAEFVGCSQQAIKRYLDKKCSFVGEYEYYTDELNKRRVRFKADSSHAELSNYVANWKSLDKPINETKQ